MKPTRNPQSLFKLRAILFLAACLAGLLALPARGAIVEWPPADLSRYPAELDKAVGYAAIFNPAKVEELTQPLIGSTDPQVRARAWWVRALAWGKFSLNYRDKTKVSQFDQARAEAVKASPTVDADQLVTLEVDLHCYVLHPEGDPQYLAALRQAAAAHPQDPVALARLGRAYYDFSAVTDQKDAARRAQDLEECVKYYRQAVDLAPESFDFAAYYVTYLWEKETDKAAVLAVAEKVLGRIDPNRSSYSDTQGPAVMLVYLRSMAADSKDPGLELKMFAEKVKSGVRTPEMLIAATKSQVNVILSGAMEQPARARVAPEAARVWWKFIIEVEEGRLVLHGYDLALLVTAYYRLAGVQADQELWEEALSSYRKITALSPHYAQVHYNFGIGYMRMMEREKDPTEKERLRGQAREAFRTQLQYLWRGIGRDEIKEILKKLE